MARKKRPSIQGIDPDYRTDFHGTKDQSAFQPAMTTATGPETAGPGRDATVVPSPDASPIAAEIPDAEAGQEAEALEAAETRQDAEAGQEAEALEATKTRQDAGAGQEAEAQTGVVKKGRDKNKRSTEVAGKEAGENPASKLDGAEKREIALDVAAKSEHGDALEALEQHGFAMRDVIVKAGRRATGRFELKPDFVPKPEAKRLPVRVGGYHTTKRVPATILDDLRQHHDPLRLKSDGAMVRGQFEPLFWACLDEVIEELQGKKG